MCMFSDSPFEGLSFTFVSFTFTVGVCSKCRMILLFRQHIHFHNLFFHFLYV